MNDQQRKAARNLRDGLLETLYGLHGWEREAQRLARLIRALDVAVGDTHYDNLARRYAHILTIHNARRAKRRAA